MVNNFFLLMLIVHTLSDFVFQTKDDIKDKNNHLIRAYIKHALILFFISLLLLINTNFSVIIKVIIIVVSHIAIDFLKVIFDKRTEKVYANLLVFVIDQILHIIVIVILTKGVILEYTILNDFLAKNLFVINDGFIREFSVIIFVALSGAYFVPMFLNIIYFNIVDYSEKLNNILKAKLGSKEEEEFIDEVKAGKWIGILERLLILFLLSMNEYTAIGFVIAIKSLTRFKMLDSKVFSEYYLIGTLTSIIYSIGGYFIINMII